MFQQSDKNTCKRLDEPLEAVYFPQNLEYVCVCENVCCAVF